MPEKDLYKVRSEININNYSLKEFAEFLESFDNKLFKITISGAYTEDIFLSFKIDNFPHLIGLQYCYDKISNKSKFSGKKGITTLKTENISIQILRKNFNHNQKKRECA